MIERRESARQIELQTRGGEATAKKTGKSVFNTHTHTHTTPNALCTQIYKAPCRDRRLFVFGGDKFAEQAAVALETRSDSGLSSRRRHQRGSWPQPADASLLCIVAQVPINAGSHEAALAAARTIARAIKILFAMHASGCR